jgi:predicted nuclease with TOPRIM domain
MNTNDPVVQYEVTKERLKNVEEKCFHLEESLKNARVTVERLQASLKQESEEKSELKVNLEVTKLKLLYAEQALNQSNQMTTSKDRQSKGRAALWTAPLRPDSKRSQLLRNIVN